MRKCGNILIIIFTKMQIKKNKITLELLTGFKVKVPATFTDTSSRGGSFFAFISVIFVNIENSTSSLLIKGI